MAEQVLTRADELIGTGDYEEAATLLESVVAMRINNDNDRRLILDAAYTLTQTFLAIGAVSKAKALCRLVVNGNRVFPGRSQELKSSMELLSKLLTKTKGKDGFHSGSSVPDSSVPLIGAQDAWDSQSIASQSQMFPQDSSANASTATRLDVEAPATPNALICTERSNKNDPSLTRFLFGSLGKRLMPSSDSANGINYITDFRNPSNPLSPHFTPFVTVPIPPHIFEPVRSNDSGETDPKSPSFLKRLGASKQTLKMERHRSVRMSRDEYLRCWARDSNGNYVGTDPEGSGDERVRRNWLASGGKAISQLEYVGHMSEGRNPFAVAT